MKLHLPKVLLGAVLAAVCAVGQQVYAEWNADQKTGGHIYYYNKDSEEITSLTMPSDISVVPTDKQSYVTSDDALSSFFLCYDTGGQTKNLTLETVTLKDGDSLTVVKNPWKDDDSAVGYYKNLVIKDLIIGNNEAENGVITYGVGSFGVGQASSVVVINKVSGTLSSVNNTGTLTIGTAAETGETPVDASTTKLSGTMTNTGTLNLNGIIEIDDLSGFDTMVEGELSNSTHGFRTGTEKAVIASSGGTINLSGVTLKIGSESTTLEDGTLSQSSITISTGNTSTSTLYEITSAYTTAVEYNGTSGDTKTATGFRLENGTTLKLTGTSTAKLTDKVTIAAGDGGKATYSIANRTEQTYDSLGLGSLLHVESGSYVLNIDGAGTMVTTSHSSNNGTGFHTGEISITNGGKLLLNNYDSLGWDSNATSKISILNGTLALSGRQTFSTDLDMQGGAVVEANTTTLADNPPKIDVWNNMDWTVSGTGNVVKNGVSVNMRKDVTLTVAAGGELSIQGAFENSSKLIKSGDGRLILEGAEKTLNGQLELAVGTLQLGGTTTDNGQVTLGGGLNQTGGTVEVVGKAMIKGSSTLNGAINVAATGELTLNSTYTLTGSLTLAEGARLLGGNDLIGSTSGSTAPDEGSNGWGTSILTILRTTGDSATVTGLATAWIGNREFTVSTSESTIDEVTYTNYQINASTDYYVQDAANKVEYSSDSGLTAAGKIYMSNGTTMVVKTDLNHNSNITLIDGAKVNYEVDGASLTVGKDGTEEGISSIVLSNGATLKVEHAFASLGTEANKVAISMNDGTSIQLNNGNSWASRNLWADILVNGDASIGGSSNGNNSTVRGTIAGNGSLKLTQAYSTNAYTIASVIADGANNGNQLAVEVNSTNDNITISGANTYSGGTTVTAGKVTTASESALGTGKVTMKGGTLTQSAALSVSAMDYEGGTVTNNGQSLTVTGKLDVKSAMLIDGDGANSIDTLAFSTALNGETYAFSTTGTLSLGTLELNLTDYGIGEYKLVSSAGLTWSSGSYSATGLADGLTAQVGFAEGSSSNLILTIGVAQSEPIDWTITDQGGYDAATGCLTLNVGADISGYDFTEDGAIIIPGISDSIMKEILGLENLPADGMVGITLVGTSGEITATADQQIGFQGEDGVYYGAQVGSQWQYQVAYIPEPTTATLSLLALCGLATRRRRK